MNSFLIKNIGDRSISVYFENIISPEINLNIHEIVERINKDKQSWLVDVVPTYNSFSVVFDINLTKSQEVKNYISEVLISKKNQEFVNENQTIINIPVKYGGEEGPDLEDVANYCNLSSDEIVKIHSSTLYLVYMTGFSPGFPYLGELDKRIHCPRLKKPRTRVSSGSVGLAGSQTGIYSIDSPGGWRIIGKTPMKLFDLKKKNPFPVIPGMKVKFFSVDLKEYTNIEKRIIEEKDFLGFEINND